MKDNKETLYNLVIQEAKRLKKHATPEELAKLSFKKLNGENFDTCIYGQITGNCFSERANELILKCAPRVYVSGDSAYSNGLVEDGKLNGKPYPVYNDDSRAAEYFSPIERLVYLKGNKLRAKKLISFLKGNTDTLTF
jgi:hypothetical protein